LVSVSLQSQGMKYQDVQNDLKTIGDSDVGQYNLGYRRMMKYH